jgi:hypothetical protein
MGHRVADGLDTRWSEDNADRSAKYAAELITLAPDMVLASGCRMKHRIQFLRRRREFITLLGARRWSFAICATHYC